jgi:flavin-dependent thymidylate synthase
MKVTLINFTQEAEELLIFTKSTRLNLSPGLLDSIRGWPVERIGEELKYIANTIKSSWEFVSYVFMIEGVSRGFTHQFVRSRHGSYAQQSMRVTNMSHYDFVMPERIAAKPSAKALVDNCNRVIMATYRGLVEDEGIPAEDARSVLPTNISTNICVKHNLRSFSDLAISRLGGRTQDEYQRVMNAMVDEVLKVHPWARDFIFGKLDRDYFAEIEAFAKEAFPDLLQRGKLLKIVDQMRAARA